MKRISLEKMTTTTPGARLDHRLLAAAPDYDGLAEDPTFWAELDAEGEDDGELEDLDPCGMPLKLGMAARDWGISERTLWEAHKHGVGPPTYTKGKKGELVFVCRRKKRKLVFVCRREMREWVRHNTILVPTSDGRCEVRWLSTCEMRPLRERPCRHGEIEP